MISPFLPPWMRPLIQLPGATPMGPMAMAAPMAQPQPMSAPPQMDAPEAPQSEYRDLAGTEMGTNGGAPADGSGSLLGGITGNRLALLGLALQGMGGPYGKNPLLAQIALRQMEQRRQEEGIGNAIQALSTAQEGAAGNRAAFSSTLAGMIRSGQYGPEGTRLLYSALQKNNESMLTDAKASEESLAAADLRRLLNEHPTGDYADVAAKNPGVMGKLSRQTADAIFKESEPVYSDLNGQRVVTYRAGQRRGKAEPIYSAPKTDKLSDTESLVEVTPGQGGQPATVNTLRQGTTPQTISPDIAAELPALGFTVDDIQKALRDPNRRELAMNLLDEAKHRAQVTGGTPKPTFENLQAWIADNPGSTLGDYYRRNREGLPGAGAAEATRYTTNEQGRRIGVASAQTENAARIREESERRQPAIALEGLRSAETEIYDRQAGKFVSKLAPGILGQAEKESDRFKVVQGDDLKSLRAVRGIERFIPMFDEVSKSLVNQPGANIPQQIEFALKERFGVASMGTVISTLQGSQLVLAKAFQGTGSQLSDADRKTVEGLVPKPGDSAQQVQQKVNFLRTYTRLIKSAVLEDDAAADFALVDFVRNLPKGAGGGAAPSLPAGMRWEK